MTKILSTLLLLLLFVPAGLFALSEPGAYLYFDQKSIEARVGENFSTSLMVSSDSQAVNAFEAIINVPNNLEIVSANYDGSVCQLFIYQPKTDNNKVDFKCGLPHGYRGTRGKLININLKALAPSDSTLSISNARVLANDGLGTNVLNSALGSNITVEPAVDTVSIKAASSVVPPTTSFEANEIAPIDNISKAQQVEITAEVGFSITGYLENNIAKVEINWNLGYGISKDANSYIISANI